MFIDRYLILQMFSLKNLQEVSIVFLTLQDFEKFLLVHAGVSNTKIVWPKYLQILTYKLEFLEFMTDEYYS
jgi:hypothetical protein